MTSQEKIAFENAELKAKIKQLKTELDTMNNLFSNERNVISDLKSALQYQTKDKEALQGELIKQIQRTKDEKDAVGQIIFEYKHSINEMQQRIKSVLEGFRMIEAAPEAADKNKLSQYFAEYYEAELLNKKWLAINIPLNV